MDIVKLTIYVNKYLDELDDVVNEPDNNTAKGYAKLELRNFLTWLKEGNEPNIV